MKKVTYIIALLSLNIFCQNKFLTKTGTVSFEASVPSFEAVAANNNAATAILNTDNGDLAVLIMVKGFRFKNALMEEHFNENYAESDTYPKATFKGKIENFSFNNLETNSSFKIIGELNFHGKTKQLKDTPIKVSMNTNNTISIVGSFKVIASDFDIKIPNIVKNKISEEIKISFKLELQPKI
ncbi:MAG: YceI family protein [Flavobacteriaceae bacterium]|nr:YceI family protein [Flavobacteriaceae bacterium]